ncbi:ABC transporter permease [Mycoplasma struthionis]|uniref:ABC transporter permease n=1 Tax=Mycoplasma struthionis TaxID=538220 RepID=UPI001B880844|nr:ABC transporter permease [Mycoplasma struthionis]
MELKPNDVKEFNSQYKINSELSTKFKLISEKDKISFVSVAGKPKKLAVEVIKRFFTNPVVVAALSVFILIILFSLIVPAPGIASYKPNRRINDYSFINNLPPLYAPIVTKTLRPDDNIWQFYNNIVEKGNENPKLKEAFAFFTSTWKRGQRPIIGSLFQIQYDAYALFKAAVLNEKLSDIIKLNTAAGRTPITDAEIAATLAQIPNLKTYLGTSPQGYDIWITTWYATWRAIKIALIVAVIQAVIGIAIGAYLGFHAGKLIDTIVMRIISIFLSPPTMIWILIFVSIFGSTERSLIISLSIVGWPGFVGLTRMFIITVKNEEYITAAKAIGASTKRQVFVHALPAIIGKIANSFVRTIPGIILWIASLAFLGFFKEKEDTNLGQLLIEASGQAGGNIWILLLPALILLALSLSLNFIALGIHDALDPKVMSKGKRK